MINHKHDLIISLLKRELPKIYLKWDREANVDNGGCGIIARFLYEGLTSIGCKPEVRALVSPFSWLTPWNSDDEVRAVQDLLLSKDNTCINTNLDLCDRGLTASHLMILWHGKYIDMSGCYDSLKETHDWGFLKDSALIPYDVLKRITSTYIGWNVIFKNEYTDEIENDIKALFTKIKSIIYKPESFRRYIKYQDKLNLIRV